MMADSAEPPPLPKPPPEDGQCFDPDDPEGIVTHIAWVWQRMHALLDMHSPLPEDSSTAERLARDQAVAVLVVSIKLTGIQDQLEELNLTGSSIEDVATAIHAIQECMP